MATLSYIYFGTAFRDENRRPPVCRSHNRRKCGYFKFRDRCYRGGGKLLSIGNNVTITNARILTHDASTKKFIGYTKIGKVSIGNDVFIGAGAIILPDTNIGNRVIVGAGCVVAKDIPDNAVVVGNPCRIVSTFEDYMNVQKQRLDEMRRRTDSIETENRTFIE